MYNNVLALIWMNMILSILISFFCNYLYVLGCLYWTYFMSLKIFWGWAKITKYRVFVKAKDYFSKEVWLSQHNTKTPA